MSIENLVLCTVYVDQDVDARLYDESLTQQASMADLFRRYLVSGIKAVKTHPDLFETVASRGITPPPILRTVYLDPKLDHKLYVKAFDSHISKSDLIRRYVHVGMRLKDAQTAQKSDASVG